jgi:hypothetical protein
MPITINNTPCESNCQAKCDYHCRVFGADTKLPTTDPAFQYKQLKVIQNTVRVPSSLYNNDLAALSVYQFPGKNGVNWNQMSDRQVPHHQFVNAPTRGNSTRRTITGIRPGAQTPGGSGVDVKHGSYDRYLMRLKGKGPARRQIVPPTFGAPIPFSSVDPVYGGKTVKTNIVGWNCKC